MQNLLFNVDFQNKEKWKNETIKYKVRLVTRGFMQEKGFDYEETFALVAKMSTVRVLLAVNESFET